ncbi:MAG: class I SAM-dependent RNA methyltransferase [Clostridiales bacterium]|nr:class I SAM-dependent RNA methyltransferase [Clostridiales bacterium]
MTHTFLATAAFGLEGVVANELKRMDIPAKAEQGGARFDGSWLDAYRANLYLRTADRVLCCLKEASVDTFDGLFRLVESIPWEHYLPKDARIHVSGKCVRSRLMSVRDCQSITKKAIVNRLQQKLHVTRLPETGAEYPVEVAIVKDIARITLDMSGDALNRRGYRTWNGEAPLRETLAAALVDLSPWRSHIRLYDPCCGTGTLLIEAAIKATQCPAGINRHFACENYAFMPRDEMSELRRAAEAFAQSDVSFDIAGSDIDPEALTLCNRHIHQAGFDGQIRVIQQDLRTLQLVGEPGIFLCNPPYGERLGDQQQTRALYKEMGLLLKRHPGWKMAVITSDSAFERNFGRRADKKRRLYNGRLECEFCIFG